MNPDEIEDLMSVISDRIVTTPQITKECYPDEYKKAGYYDRKKITHDYNRKMNYLQKHDYIRQMGMDPLQKTVFWVAIR